MPEFEEKEFAKNAVVSKMEITANDGKNYMRGNVV